MKFLWCIVVLSCLLLLQDIFCDGFVLINQRQKRQSSTAANEKDAIIKNERSFGFLDIFDDLFDYENDSEDDEKYLICRNCTVVVQSAGGSQAQPVAGASPSSAGGAQAQPAGGAQPGGTGGTQLQPAGGAPAGNTGGTQSEPVAGAPAGNTGGTQPEPVAGAPAGSTGSDSAQPAAGAQDQSAAENQP